MNAPISPKAPALEIFHKAAVISDCGKYRYKLYRAWTPEPRSHIAWVMLNPSTADANIDDPTIRRCMAFSHSWGYHGMWVGNLYAYRATDPSEMLALAADVARGPSNDRYLREMLTDSHRVVFAWGANGSLIKEALPSLADARNVVCLGRTKSGQPKHPLYIPAAQQLERYAA